MKRIKKLVAAAGVAVVVLIISLLLGIDYLAKVGVEQGGTYALGVKTTLDSMDVGIFSGSVEMANLTVVNPPGFDTPHFLTLGAGRVAVSLRSLMGDKVVVPELTLSGLSINLERKGKLANYNTIFAALKKFESAEQSSSSEVKEGKRFVIEKVTIEDVEVQVDLLPIGGKLTRLPVMIERIELENVGTDSDRGVLMGDLIDILIKAVLEAVLQKSGDLFPGDIAAELQQGLAGLAGLGSTSVQLVGDVTTRVGGEVKKVTDMSAAAVEKLGEEGKNIAEDLEDAGKKLEEDVGEALKKGLGGLFGGDKAKKDNDE